MPLVGENRVIARLGLASLSKGPHTVGLRALLEASGLTGKTIDSYQVGFILAPRVNAAGRMSTPDIATRLLLATDEAMGDEARALAQQLNDENLRRQQEEAELVAQAKKAIETDPAVGAHNVLVVGGEGWHRGVIGIVASKLVDAYHKPAIVLSIDGDVAHGSCRSIPDFDMLGALERCADLFLKFGGHKQAAGLTMEAARVPEFRARINAHADEVLEPDQLRPRLRIDGPLTLRGDHARPDGRPRRDGPVRPGESAAGLPRQRRRNRRRPAHAQGAPPEDDLRAGRPPLPRHRLARGRARRLPHPQPRRRQPRLLARAQPVPGGDLPGAERLRFQESGRVRLNHSHVLAEEGAVRHRRVRDRVCRRGRRGHAPAHGHAVKAPLPQREDPSSIAETRGGVTHERTNKEGKTTFKIHAESEFVYPDGRAVLRGVTLTLPDRDGRTLMVTANELENIGKAGQAVGNVHLTGDVHLKTSDGIDVKAAEATYDDGGGIADGARARSSFLAAG